VWAVFVGLIGVFAPELPVYPAGLVWVVLSAAAVAAGSLFGMAFSRSHSTQRPPGEQTYPALGRVVLLLTLIGLTGTVALLSSQHQPLSALFSLKSLEGLGQAFSDARYQVAGYTEPVLTRIGLAAIYCGALLGGLLLAQSKQRPRLRAVGLFPILPAVSIAVVETTKATVYLTVLLVIGSYLASRVGVRGASKRVIAGLAIAVVLAIPSTIWLQLNRYGYSVSNDVQVTEVTGRLHVAVFGSLPVFSYWFDHQASSVPLGWGTISFFGPTNLLSTRSRVPGVYNSAVSFGSGLSSNIYTMYRGLIEDFSAPGSLLVLFALGLGSRYAYGGAKRGRLPSMAVLSGFYTISIWSFFVNPFGYDTVLIGWLAFTAYVWGVELSRRRGRTQSERGPIHRSRHEPSAGVGTTQRLAIDSQRERG
jgi:oligosaccharide repeat unit polymerase